MKEKLFFADIPGLIEGSHTGKGLGHQFLQHIERTKILVHVVDPLGFEKKSPRENIKVIQKELKEYSQKLAKKLEILVINKQDLTSADKTFKEVKRAYRKRNVLAISGVSGQGIPELLAEVVKELDHLPVKKQKIDTKPLRISLEPEFWVEKGTGNFIVRGKNVERLIAMTNFDLEEGVERTQNILKKMGIERALIANGAKEGDPVVIGGFEFSFLPDEGVTRKSHQRSRSR